MAYDPNLPANDSFGSSAQMRGQLQGIVDLIQTIPVGPPGAPGPQGGPGPQGPPFANAVVDGVTTLDPGTPATVTAALVGTEVHFAFGIPQGSVGETGAVGPVGPAFTNFVVQSTTALEAGEPATVAAVFDGAAVQLSFGLPKGDTGPQGAPGEVTAAALTAAINTTAQNTNGVLPLALTVSDPPTQAEMQQMADKIDELITALTRVIPP